MQAKSDVYKAAEDRLVVNKYDLDAWNVLIKDHQVMFLLNLFLESGTNCVSSPFMVNYLIGKLLLILPMVN